MIFCLLFSAVSSPYLLLIPPGTATLMIGESELDTILEGDLFGAMSALLEIQHLASSTVLAKTDLELWVIPADYVEVLFSYRQRLFER